MTLLRKFQIAILCVLALVVGGEVGNRIVDVRLENTNLHATVRMLMTEIIEQRVEMAAFEAEVASLTAEIRRSGMEGSKPAPSPAPVPAVTMTGWQSGKASWYGPGLYGNKTADGTVLTTATVCVAHKTLPLGTRIAVRYRGRTVETIVRDRGPYVAGRTLDLSHALAEQLGFTGVGTVEWRRL